MCTLGGMYVYFTTVQFWFYVVFVMDKVFYLYA